MSREQRARSWLVGHQSTLDDLRSAEIRLAVALDALRREVTARHADNDDLIAEIAAAADELAQHSATALTLPDVPELRGNLFFHAACQRFGAVTTQICTGSQNMTPAELSEAAEEIRIGRGELDEALSIVEQAAR